MISDDIRSILKTADDGMTVREIAKALDLPVRDRVDASIVRIVDAYIDRWQTTERGKFEAVWMVVDVPPHAPKPTARAAAVYMGGDA